MVLTGADESVVFDFPLDCGRSTVAINRCSDSTVSCFWKQDEVGSIFVPGKVLDTERMFSISPFCGRKRFLFLAFTPVFVYISCAFLGNVCVPFT